MKEVKTHEFELSIEEIREIIRNHVLDKKKDEFGDLKVKTSLAFDLEAIDFDGPGCPSYRVKSATLKVRTE